MGSLMGGSMTYPQDPLYPHDGGYPQNPRYNQQRRYPSDTRYQQPVQALPAQYSPQAQAYHEQQYGYSDTQYAAPDMRHQSPGPSYQDYQRPPPMHQMQMPLHGGNPYAQAQPPYPVVPASGMQLMTSTIEQPQPYHSRPYANEKQQMMNPMPRGPSPPPAYSRDAGSANSRIPASSIDSPYYGGQIMAAESTGQLADYKLVAIPATSKKLGSPFLRAYPPALHNYGISREAFLQFIDHLNRAAVASPPIQVLGLAGNIVGMVPLHTAQIVGNAVNAAATIGTIAVSKGRTEMLLKEANSTLFKDAGLKVQIAKLDVVAKLAKIPILDAEGKVDKKSSVLMAFDESEDVHEMSAQQRRVKALGTWLSPLDVGELPELDNETNFMGRMHAKVSESQRAKEEKKMMKDRTKAHKDYTKHKNKEEDEYAEKMEKYEAKEAKIRRKGGKDLERDLRRLNRSIEKLNEEHDKEMRKIRKHRLKDDKEEESMRKILFLIIQKL